MSADASSGLEDPLANMSINITDDNELVFDPAKKKSSRKRRAVATNAVEGIGSEQNDGKAVERDGDGGRHKRDDSRSMAVLDDDYWKDSDRDYYYSELIAWIYEKIVADKNLGGLKGVKKSIEPPEVGKIGTKKIAWVNFVNNCKSINRKSEHVLDFVLTELGAQGSIASDGKLIIKGRFQSKQLESVLRRYIAEYVVCRTCRSGNTELKKENRITFKVCKDCGATSSVANIKQGFRVQTKRKK